MNLRLRAISLFLVALAGCSGRAANDATFPQPSSAIELTLNLQVGADEKADAVLFNLAGVVDVDDEGYMYVTDWADLLVRVLDPDGKLVTTLGRRGEGPGEFRGPPGRTLVTADSASVFWADGISVFHPRTGAYLDHVGLGGAHTYSLILERDGWVWTVLMIGALARVEVLSGTVLESRPLPPDPWLSAVGGTKELAEALPRNLCASAPTGIYCGTTDSGLLTVYSHALDSTGTVRIPFEIDQISASDRDWINASSRSKREFDIPDHWPAYRDLIADDQGRLWFKLRFDRKDSESRFWVVDPATQSIAEATATGDVSLWTIVRGQAYGVREDQNGQRTVVRYAVSSAIP